VIAELESGTRSSASLVTLKRLATTLEVTVDALVSESASAPRGMKHRNPRAVQTSRGVSHKEDYSRD
jgi:hypothetical protein